MPLITPLCAALGAVILIVLAAAALGNLKAALGAAFL